MSEISLSGGSLAPQEMIAKFRNLMECAKNTNDAKLFAQANEVAEGIIDITRLTYESVCGTYRDVRGNKIKEIDNICWTALNKCIGRYVSENKSHVSILDVGTGNGRDLIYGQQQGYNVVGIDNCDGFIDILQHHCEAGLIKPCSYKKCDMRDLSFADESFDVVRHNATLLHLPLVGKGYTVDLAVQESWRVLKPGGLLYVFVKTGTELAMLDTKENLGGRVFQFFNHSMINEVVTRNGFNIVFTSDEVEYRENSTIDWILLIARKGEA